MSQHIDIQIEKKVLRLEKMMGW